MSASVSPLGRVLLLTSLAVAGAASAQSSAPMGLRPAAKPQLVTLEQAFGLAVQQSYDLRIAEARVDEAQANVKRAWAMLLPNLSVGGGYTYNFPESTFSLGDPEQFKQQALLFNSIADITAQSGAANPDPVVQAAAAARAEELRQVATDLENTEIEEIAIQPTHVFDGQVQMQVPLFNGRALPLVQNAYASVDVTRLAGRQARAQVIYGVARAYYQAVAAQRIAGISKGQVESATRHRDLAKQRVGAGLITPLALQRAELDLARSQQARRAAEGGLLLAKASLGSLIGVIEDFQLQEPPAVPAIETSGTTEAMLARAFQARDDLRLQKAALGIADRNKVDAWMRFLPTVALTASGRATSNTAGLVSQPFTGAVGVQASLPLFDGGQTLAAIDESDARLRQELLRVRQLEHSIEQNVRGSLDDLTLKRDAVQIAGNVAKLAGAQKKNVDQLFEAGAATSLDVADAHLSAFSAEVDAARAGFDLETARLGLAYALGELRPLEELAPAPLADKEVDAARARVDALPE